MALENRLENFVHTAITDARAYTLINGRAQSFQLNRRGKRFPRGQFLIRHDGLRPDIAEAVGRVSGLLVGSVKEINLLGDYLHSEERVLALTTVVTMIGIFAHSRSRSVTVSPS